MENKINVSNHQPAWVWFYKTTRSSINLFLINWLVGEFHPGQKLPGFAITFGNGKQTMPETKNTSAYMSLYVIAYDSRFIIC